MRRLCAGLQIANLRQLGKLKMLDYLILDKRLARFENASARLPTTDFFIYGDVLLFI